MKTLGCANAKAVTDAVAEARTATSGLKMLECHCCILHVVLLGFGGFL